MAGQRCKSVASITFVSFLFIAGTSCTKDSDRVELRSDARRLVEQKIIGGEASTDSDYRSAGVLLVVAEGWRREMGAMLCSGTLIAPDVVLSAAHCSADVMMMGIESMHVTYYFSFSLDVTTFGLPSLELPERSYRVARRVSHPGFSIDQMEDFPNGLAQRDDIALLFLDARVPDVEPAVLLRREDRDSIVRGSPVAIVGYGQTVHPAPAPGPHQTIPVGVKHHAISTINEVGTYEMQVGNVKPEARKCHGDSGGPTYMDFLDDYEPPTRVVGVTSHAYDRSDCHKGGVDTRVDAYLDWIDEQMRLACDRLWRIDCANDGTISAPRHKITGRSDTRLDDDAPRSITEHVVGGCASTHKRGTVTLALGSLLIAFAVRRRRRRRARR